MNYEQLENRELAQTLKDYVTRRVFFRFRFIRESSFNLTRRDEDIENELSLSACTS